MYKPPVHFWYCSVKRYEIPILIEENGLSAHEAFTADYGKYERYYEIAYEYKKAWIAHAFLLCKKYLFYSALILILNSCKMKVVCER